jgi:hypothetical protein
MVNVSSEVAAAERAPAATSPSVNSIDPTHARAFRLDLLILGVVILGVIILGLVTGDPTSRPSSPFPSAPDSVAGGADYPPATAAAVLSYARNCDVPFGPSDHAIV